MMTHWERVHAALKGEDVDRVPVSMWRHFYGQETSAASLAEAMLSFQSRFGWDFMKVNPRASYHVEDWGVELKYDGDNPPHVTKIPVSSPEDWLKLQVLDVNKGVLGEQLQSLEMIAKGLKGEVPFIMTVFTPLSIASRLVGSAETFMGHLREHTEKVHYAMDVIAETFTRFSKACLERGCAGIFYATTTWATKDRFSEEEYAKLARPFDLKLLRGLSPAEFNVLHVCSRNNLFKSVLDYPVQAFSWDPRETSNPSLMEGKLLAGGRAVIGGIAHDKSLVEADPERLSGEVLGLQVAMGKRGRMLGPGCTFPPATPEANLQAIRHAVGD
jgi:uroporphyrinogen decarboxylase